MANQAQTLAQFAPMLPGIINSVMGIVDAINADPAMSAEEKAALLEALSVRLHATAARVADVELPDLPPDEPAA